MEQLRQREVTGNPWLKLRLPDGHEEVIRSLIHSHFARQRSGGVHFDLLRNKGKDICSPPVPRFLPVYSSNGLNRKWGDYSLARRTRSWENIYGW